LRGPRMDKIIDLGERRALRKLSPLASTLTGW
jgi:hypothetical protein